MFYSATPELGARKTAVLNNQGDPSFWLVVRVSNEIVLLFALLNEQTGPLGRIISALTKSAVYHVETWLANGASGAVVQAAEMPVDRRYKYDTEGALKAWDDSGYHTIGEEFCSGFSYEILRNVMAGLQPYPNPGRLLGQVPAMLGQPVPKLAVPAVELTDADFDYLASLAPHEIATGTCQQLMEVLGA